MDAVASAETSSASSPVFYQGLVRIFTTVGVMATAALLIGLFIILTGVFLPVMVQVVIAMVVGNLVTLVLFKKARYLIGS